MAEEKLKLWWLSFADANRPKGRQFLGACVVWGFDLKDAIVRSHMAKCNPGGAIISGELPEESVRRMPKDRIDTLFSKQEALWVAAQISSDLDAKN